MSYNLLNKVRRNSVLSNLAFHGLLKYPVKVNYLYAKSSVKNFVPFSHCRRELGNSELSPFHLKQIDYQRNVISPAMRCPTPMELFLLRSQVVGAHKIPGTD